MSITCWYVSFRNLHLLNPLLNPTRWLDGQKSTINNKKHNSLDLCKVVVSRWGYEHVFFVFFNFQGYIESSMIHSSWPFHHFGILEQEVLNMIMPFTLEKEWLHPREGGWSSQDLFEWLGLAISHFGHLEGVGKPILRGTKNQAWAK